MRYSDAAFQDDLIQRMDEDVDRICMFLLEACLEEWAKTPEQYCNNLHAARAQLYDPKPKRDAASKNEDASDVPEVLTVHHLYRAEHLAYWFEVRADYWNPGTSPKATPSSKDKCVAVEDLEALLWQARSIQGQVKAAAEGGKDSGVQGAELAEQRVRTIETVMRVRVQKLSPGPKDERAHVEAPGGASQPP